MQLQKNAIYYHDSNGKPINAYRYATAKRLAITMSDRILVTLVANDGSATLGYILGVMLEDGSGKNFMVRMIDAGHGTVLKKFVKDEKPTSSK